jgi:hypothetical protein
MNNLSFKNIISLPCKNKYFNQVTKKPTLNTK